MCEGGEPWIGQKFGPEPADISHDEVFGGKLDMGRHICGEGCRQVEDKRVVVVIAISAFQERLCGVVQDVDRLSDVRKQLWKIGSGGGHGVEGLAGGRSLGRCIFGVVPNAREKRLDIDRNCYLLHAVIVFGGKIKGYFLKAWYILGMSVPRR